MVHAVMLWYSTGFNERIFPERYRYGDLVLCAMGEQTIDVTPSLLPPRSYKTVFIIPWLSLLSFSNFNWQMRKLKQDAIKLK